VEGLEQRTLLSITLGTNQLDYVAGDNASISASGFASGETVQLQVVHDPNTPVNGKYPLIGDANLNGAVNSADMGIVLANYNQSGMTWSRGDFDYNGTVNSADLAKVLANYNQSGGLVCGPDHAPWLVTDGGQGDLDGMIDGNIQTSWYVNPDDSTGAKFIATATGQSSGLFAQTVFYDGAFYTTDGTTGNDGKYDRIEQFDHKQDVLIVGGQALKENTSYYVQVTGPAESGPNEVLLGTSIGTDNETPITTDNNGDFGPLVLWDLVHRASDGTQGFDDTPNTGGTYKVWIATTQDFDAQTTHTFHVEVVTIPYSIRGTKYEDVDGDGSKDAGEPGLKDWTVFVDVNGNGVNDDGYSAITGPDGSYAIDITNLQAGTYPVLEVPQPGWTQTAGSKQQITAGQDTGGVDFGNFQNVTIGGTKYEDVNGDDAQDATPVGIGDDTVLDTSNSHYVPVEVKLFDTSGAVVQDTWTGPDGKYAFDPVGPGTYTVVEDVPTGWTQTGGPAPITVASGQNVDNANLADFMNVTISGMKFEDHNGNGVQDPGDQPLAGWTIILDDNGNGIVDSGERSAVTADGTTAVPLGMYSFDNVGLGMHTVSEATPPEYWVPTLGEDGYTIQVGNPGNDAGLTNPVPTNVGSTASDTFIISGGTDTANFGNTNVGVENAKTIGFWSNKNGQALITQPEIDALNALHLTDAGGVDQNWTGSLDQEKALLKTFLLGANATNMANMLSAQLAATLLNSLSGRFGGSTAIYVDDVLTNWPGNSQGTDLATNLDHDGNADNADATGNVNQYGFADIQGLINAANEELAIWNLTIGASADRTYEEALKIAFDGINNNLVIFAI